MARPRPTPSLRPTRRQLEVLRARCETGSRKEAAALLGISPETVRWHLARLFESYAEMLLAIAEAFDCLTEVPDVLRPTTEAMTLLGEWRTELERRQRPRNDLAGIRGWASKLPGATVRLAGLLHVARTICDGIDRPIDAQTMTAAITLARSHVPHALAAYDLMGTDGHLALNRRIAGWFVHENLTMFTRRQVLRDVRPRPDVKDAGAALALLESYGWIAPENPDERPGRPSARYQVNPQVLGQTGQ